MSISKETEQLLRDISDMMVKLEKKITSEQKEDKKNE